MRRSDRTVANIKARIIRGGQQDTACIEDLAHGGMKLGGIRTLGVGDSVEVQVDGASVTVEVIWVHAMRCGARFLPDTCPEAVSRFRAICAHRRGMPQDSDAASRTRRGEKPLSAPG